MITLSKKTYEDVVLSLHPLHYWPLDGFGGLTDRIGGGVGSLHPNSEFEADEDFFGGVLNQVRTSHHHPAGFDTGENLEWQSTYTLSAWLNISTDGGGESIFVAGGYESPLYIHTNGTFFTYRGGSPGYSWGSAAAWRGVWMLVSFSSEWDAMAGKANYTFRRRRVDDAAAATKQTHEATVGANTTGNLTLGGSGHGGPLLGSYAHLMWWDRPIGDDEFEALFLTATNGAI